MDEAKAFFWGKSSNSDMKEPFVKDPLALTAILRVHRTLPMSLKLQGISLSIA